MSNYACHSISTHVYFISPINFLFDLCAGHSELGKYVNIIIHKTIDIIVQLI